MRVSKWYSLGKFTTRYSVVIVLAVVGLTIPCAISGLQYKKTTSVTMFTPRGSGEFARVSWDH